MKRSIILIPLALGLISCRGVRLQTPVEVSKVQSPVVVDQPKHTCGPVYVPPTPDGQAAINIMRDQEVPYTCDPKTGNCYLKPEHGKVCGPVAKSEDKEPGLRKQPVQTRMPDDQTVPMLVLASLFALCAVLIIRA